MTRLSQDWWRSLPVPQSGQLGVYLFGSGVGESLVVLSAEGWSIVVDGCEHAGHNLPLELVRGMKSAVGLLIITHPDLDHIRGTAELVRETKPGEIWRYPLGAAPLDAILRWARELNPPLSEALLSLEAQQHATGAVFSVSHGHEWTAASGACSVRAFAPTPYDQSRAAKVWERLVGPRPKRQQKLNDYLREVVTGKRRLGSVANVLSIGAVLTWGRHKLIIGGDVMRGTRWPFSGWKGVISLLDKRGPRDLLDDATLVKIAHHGSSHSYEPLAWSRHAGRGKTQVVLTPFTPSRLPVEATLTALRKHAAALGISHVDRATEARALTSGWKPRRPGRAHGASIPACVGAILDSANGAQLWAISSAAVFE